MEKRLHCKEKHFVANIFVPVYLYIYCVYPAISKSEKQLPNCLKINETSVVLSVFNCIISDVSTLLLPFLSVTLHESGTRNALLGPWPNNTEVYLTPLISTKNYRMKVLIYHIRLYYME